MAYNKIVSKTIGFKTRDLELAIFLCLQGVNKACDCRYSLSLETLSYYSPLTCHARPACYMRYMHGMHVNKLLKPVYKINHECSLCPLISTVSATQLVNTLDLDKHATTVWIGKG